MEQAKLRRSNEHSMRDLLEDFLISHLLLSNVPQRAVQKIVRVDIRRVNRIGKILKVAKERGT